MWYILITVLILVASLALILIVLVQNSKGGGLASGFSSSNQIMGVRKTTDVVEKATWGLAGAVIVLSILAAAFIPRDEVKNSAIKSEIQIPAVNPNAATPGFEAPAADQPATEAPATEPAPAPAAE